MKYFPSYRDNFSAAALSELVPGAGGDHGQCARHRVVAAAGTGRLQGRAHHRRPVAQEIIVQELEKYLPSTKNILTAAHNDHVSEGDLQEAAEEAQPLGQVVLQDVVIIVTNRVQVVLGQLASQLVP